MTHLETFNQQYRLGEGETVEFLEFQVRGAGLRSQSVPAASQLQELLESETQVE